ncbi:MAG TPA: NAD-dependent epimerase/dehydratase family protein [Casimicrobiaceae bacterium]|nr:NAD-dependent epimerase/dehydratase family protein [Casimicrobiaceae bacterium]
MAASRRRILVTGGAGFVGSRLALGWKEAFPETEVIALDNLKRRGSELALPRLRAGGVAFVHGDIRSFEDLEAIGPVDLMIECSAEPSVHAGYGQSPQFLINTNLLGLANCLEHLRRTGGDLVFLSSSRVYSIAPLRELPLVRDADRLVIPPGMSGIGWSPAGISEEFSLRGARSLYGTTKLAGELLIEEYRSVYGLRAFVNRCGVIAGPWQMGKVDQGFVVLWMARHMYGGSLSYSGFGGDGLQVRDVLHIDDLLELLLLQVASSDRMDGCVFNVGGGGDRSTSLAELTKSCAKVSGRSIEVSRVPDTKPADVPWYVTDHALVTRTLGWAPTRDVAKTLEDVAKWLHDHRRELEPILA